MTARVLLVLMLWVPFGVYLAGFWPGVMTYDSLSQWAQATGRLPWTDVHPVLSTVGFWVAAKFGSPAFLAAAHSLFLAAALAAVLRAVQELGAATWAVYLAGAVVVSAPSVGIFSVSLWKDVPFTAAVLMLGAQVLRLAAVRLRLLGDDTPGAQQIALRTLLRRAVGWAVLAMLLRQNGVVVGVVVLLAVALAFPRLRRRAAVAAALLPVVFLAVREVLLPGLGVLPAKTSIVQQIPAHDVAAYVRTAPQTLTEDDWNRVEAVGTRGAWAVGYDCRSLHPLIEQGDFRNGAMDQFPEVVPTLWRTLVARSPGVLVRHRICASELAWHPFGAKDAWFFTAGRAVERNALGLKSAPLDETLDEKLNQAVSVTEKPGLRPFYWRAPLWIMLAFVVLGREAVRRRRPLWLVAASPILAQQIAVVLANPAQDARYMAAAGLFAVLLLPLATRTTSEDVARGAPVPSPDESRRPSRVPYRPS